MVCFMIILIFDKLESNFCRSLAAHSPVMYATVRSQYSSKVVSGTIWWSVKNENNCYFSVII